MPTHPHPCFPHWAAYLSKHSVFEHLQSTLHLLCKTPGLTGIQDNRSHNYRVDLDLCFPGYHPARKHSLQSTNASLSCCYSCRDLSAHFIIQCYNGPQVFEFWHYLDIHSSATYHSRAIRFTSDRVDYLSFPFVYL